MTNDTSAGVARKTEAELRVELAAFYRVVAMFGWDDLVANHISVRLPGEDHAFLLNPFGLMFEEITASSLVRVDLDGNILQDTNYSINKAGYVIHSAVHAMRPDAQCVAHLHTRDGVAVSMTGTGLLPLNQTAMMIHDEVTYHDYEGPAFDLSERERLQHDLGTKNLMILRNHGTMALGRSVAEAFQRLYSLEWSCQVQVRALAMEQPLVRPGEAATARMDNRPKADALRAYAEQRSWPAILRKLDRVNPGYAD
ncbi:MAG: class II aldolase/adducin family protein [Novosphingobium sp.]|nr:class II aldolase/adducin family protein [Novosphingobium sp.]